MASTLDKCNQSIKQAAKEKKLNTDESGWTDPDSCTSPTHIFDIVVVGAGVIGLSIAQQFLLHSDLSVAVVDASVPCSGATGAGRGFLWLIHRKPGSALWDLAKRSQQLWHILVEHLQGQGTDPLEALGWKKTGSLVVGRTKEESDQLKCMVKQFEAAGIRAEYLSGNDLRLKEAALAVGPEGCAAYLSDDSQIDVRKIVALIEKGNRVFASQQRYAEFYNDPVLRFLRFNKDGKVDGVKTRNNTIYANRAVVVAAGCWTGPLMQKLTGDCEIPVKVPVQPRKGYLHVLDNFKSLKLNHGVMELGYINYVKPSIENSISEVEQTDTEQSLSISMAATLDAEGNLLIANIANSELAYGLTVPDGIPVIGPIPSMPNVFLATGHEGSGITMAPATAELVVDMILGNPMKVDPTPFAVEDQCC